MNYKYVLVIFFTFLILPFGLPKSIQKKVDKEIKKVFSIESFSLKAKVFSSEAITDLPAKFEDNNLFKIVKNDSLIGYAYISKAASKTDEFDYLILFDTDFIILKTKVLIYREDYGGEIGSKRWLKQFIGKTKDDQLRLNENIVAISGATISVRSMTKAINDVLVSIKILYQKNQL